eukprot:CAMPEP_0119319092 /NCGR_PEP_ID=MMETSP1333-20130426/48454_1 /TAXON_ID=418940 /ORGANISM="Scyphosphaera apsteinii, Strain RCC1455" /LENGTH=74 /DNA_ID=CAMNT_0007325429 /DNA_START=12 /DNA_END=232 /DNA_ORIENTATION=+
MSELPLPSYAKTHPNGSTDKGLRTAGRILVLSALVVLQFYNSYSLSAYGIALEESRERHEQLQSSLREATMKFR